MDTRVGVIYSHKCCKKINKLSSSCSYPNRLISCSWLFRHSVRQKYSYAVHNWAMAVTYVHPFHAGNTSIVSAWVLRDEDLVGCFNCWMPWRFRNVTALSFGRDTAQCWIKFYLVFFVVSLDKYRVKVKQSHYRPGQALRVPGDWVAHFCRQSAQKGGKFASLRHRSPLPQETFLILISVRGWVDPRAKLRPEGLCQWKNQMTPWGIEPATFRLVAQCLNQLRCSVPRTNIHENTDITQIILKCTVK
jgi:hypothetical protein